MLPNDLKRDLIPLLLEAQNPTILMAGLIPLNLDTFVNVNAFGENVAHCKNC